MKKSIECLKTTTIGGLVAVVFFGVISEWGVGVAELFRQTGLPAEDGKSGAVGAGEPMRV